MRRFRTPKHKRHSDDELDTPRLRAALESTRDGSSSGGPTPKMKALEKHDYDAFDEAIKRERAILLRQRGVIAAANAHGTKT